MVITMGNGFGTKEAAKMWFEKKYFVFLNKFQIVELGFLFIFIAS